MFTSRRIFLSVNFVTALLCITNIAHSSPTTSIIFKDPINPINKSYVYGELLYVKPNSDNLKYATFVSGTQPYLQSWHYQEINPSYHPAFELGFNYALNNPVYSVAAYWTHLNSNDTDSKQAATSVAISTIEFVGPPYEMSPPVFGIKSVNSKVNFDFNSVVFNAVRWIDFSPNVQAQFFGGISLLKLNQTITTTFGDYAGSLPTPYSYPLPPDPSFSFQTENVSRYLGAGPDIGMSLSYTTDSGFGLMGQFLGLLTAGTMKAKDDFTSTSARLTSVGIGTSHQQITTPNATQVVLGTDSKLGIFYNYHGINIPNLTIEFGYRIAAYVNAISTIMPNTLVQPGTVVTTPEFSTGTMAIVSTNAKSHPFYFNGPFLNIKVAIA